MSWLREWEWRFSRLGEVESFALAILSIAVKGITLYHAGLGIAIAVLAATIAIVPHELAHRQTARQYGCYSRFTLNFTGFLFTTIINLLPFFGLVFFSGYTLISCRFFSADKRIDGITAAAGPITNLVISALFLALAAFTPNFLLSFIFQTIAGFNAVVGFFNLLPFWILDGLKVFRWNVVVWVILIAMSLVMMFLTGEI
ncbi:peptidase M50 [Metallosphaera tengchongensis]|uniref:Peptidase M50 n=1 Tax=Metallosphaera tengchongensis TaxID=1532350 RepID=A0A6N0NSP5_9CREN|nr:peptidase M50 [Metallosphaera tengchongensis]QKQ99755.1 peptidase M50 [Metallosphaera tengchongensis]